MVSLARTCRPGSARLSSARQPSIHACSLVACHDFRATTKMSSLAPDGAGLQRCSDRAQPPNLCHQREWKEATVLTHFDRAVYADGQKCVPGRPKRTRIARKVVHGSTYSYGIVLPFNYTDYDACPLSLRIRRTSRFFPPLFTSSSWVFSFS